ncbi:hypothetical protein SAMN05421806_1011203 [Streptomyces indicus]|uniref:Uncharacterized protein n=1 Tax=Streptomyces indicus TaxID=417292 RepID=A0A1G8V2B7_9ACTN|nr:hypothetical protein SAMN05421806_1011203 [Streptomyces indicus]
MSCRLSLPAGSWGSAMHEEFLCEVTAYGICGGEQVGVPLGAYRAPSLPLAMWWLRERATWIAERLDPSPGAGRLPPGALVLMARDAPDVPGVLRAWRDSPAEQERAAADLASGRLVRFIARDDTTEYELLAESVDMIRIQRALGARQRAAPEWSTPGWSAPGRSTSGWSAPAWESPERTAPEWSTPEWNAPERTAPHRGVPHRGTPQWVPPM